MADALGVSMDAAEYKRVVLGLIVHKFISDAFEQIHISQKNRVALASHRMKRSFKVHDSE